jgi:C4-dicarboxylate transporter DctQ subunit
MAATLIRIANALAAAIRVTAGLLLVASVLINSANIIGRYFLAESLPWAEESMLFLMVGFVFLGNALVGWTDKQIRMDVVAAMLPPRLRAGVKLFADLVFIATAVLLAVFAWPVIVMLWDFDQRSPAANFPLFIPQALVPLGLLLTAFLVAIRLYARPDSAAPRPTEH